MECLTVQERLPSFIEDTIPPGEKAVVAEHLRSCRQCSAALADLEKTIHYLKDLEEVEPPPWLTRKVMTKIREEASPKKGLLRRLFYPMHIKLPVEAAAAVLIIGLALYVHRDIQPEIKLAEAPAEKAAPQPLLSERDHPPADKEDKPIPLSPQSGREGREGEKREVAPVKPGEQPIHSGGPELQKERSENAAEAPEQKKQAEAFRKQEAPVKMAEEQAPATGEAPKDEARREALPAAPRAKASATNGQKEVLPGITMQVKDLAGAVKEIEETLPKIEGNILKVLSFEQKAILTVELDAQKKEVLVEKLKSLGEMRETAMSFVHSGGRAEVTIEIVETSGQPR